MKIIKYLICSFFILLLNCKKVETNKEYVQLLWKNDTFDWMPSSLVLKDNLLYFADLNRNFYAVNLENAKVELNFKTDYNPIHKPLIVDQNLFLTEYNSDLNCFDKTSKLKWKIKGEINLRNDLSQYNQFIYGSVLGNGFSKIDKTTGKVIWFLPEASNNTETNGPAFFKEMIYLGFSDFNAKLSAINNQNGKIIWENKYENFKTISQYTTDKGLLVFLNKDLKEGKILMLDYQNGNEIWSKSINCDLHYEPNLADDNVIFSTYNNKVLSINIENGKTNWLLNLKNDQVETSVVNFKESVYFGTINRKLYSVNKKTGNINFMQQFNFGLITPIIENNKIYFPTGGNEIWVLK
ncbi:PQQ-binding-like beta-propeller repeat protein [Flavobacterium sp. LC2016-01]|uniref:PQQ-binding-like beta-propeller repeat protein n=1 Tax=Flavobacterium sp. LC2016-01 TaxID=2675876 RepID=UPI0012BAD2E5|nr:PQQ-binding-like beta-propeller repeat protein [Flavobacterium sp. LC2016-01]MTH16763.1 PQQ-binding-like beta-propeller repeat protein [Flavobacterium sp. LC2016-01]